MRKYFDRWTLAGAALALIAWGLVPNATKASIIQAIIPQVVPTTYFQGTATSSTKFQGATGSTTNGHCAQYDATGLLVDSGAGCVGSGSGTPGSTLFSATTSAGPNNSAAETSLVGSVTGSTTIVANTFTDGAILEARSQGFFSLPAVADSITLKMKCGSTVIGSASTTLGAGVLTNGAFRFWLLITARGSGAGGSFITNGVAEFTGSALTPSEVKIVNTTTVAFDFTTSCAFDISAQWGGAQSGELITGTNAAAWFPGAPVTSVFGRTGAVVAASNDYNFNQLAGSLATAQVGVPQGNGTKVQLSTGSTTTNDCVKFDANGNVVDAGAACASGSGSFVLVEEHTASASATIPFTTCISATYDTYDIEFVAVVPTTSGGKIGFQVSNSGVFDTTSGHYQWSALAISSGGVGGNGSGSDSASYIDNETNSTASNGGVNGSAKFYNPASSTANKFFAGLFSAENAAANSNLSWIFNGQYAQTTAVDGFRIVSSPTPATSTIASGTVRCYGIAK